MQTIIFFPSWQQYFIPNDPIVNASEAQQDEKGSHRGPRECGYSVYNEKWCVKLFGLYPGVCIAYH